MSVNIGNKIFMNLQEAVGWLLANNALPFQCNVPYVADTEIAKTAIINPSPAEIKIGSLVLFADSKVGTVSGLTTYGFMVGSEYTDIQSALAYIANVNVNASGNLITTLSDGTVIDAGKIKAISNFSINASQHLIANYNNGTTQDLGAIFTGNVNIAGNFTADSIIENMSGYSFTLPTSDKVTYNFIFASACKNGNKLTLVSYFKLTRIGTGAYIPTGSWGIPQAVGQKLIPIGDNFLCCYQVYCAKAPQNTGIALHGTIQKYSNTQLNQFLYNINSLDENVEYLVRIEITFLLGDSLV